MVKIGHNLITTAPKSPGRKLQRRRSICVDMVYILEFTQNKQEGF